LARARQTATARAWRDAAHQFLLWDTGLRVTASCLAQFTDLRLATRLVDGVPVEFTVLRYRKKTRGRGADWGEVVITPDTLAACQWVCGVPCGVPDPARWGRRLCRILRLKTGRRLSRRKER
jgi:hypothetical protein